MIGRYAFSIVVGSVITLSLIFVMHLLIEHAEDAISKEGTKHVLDFVRVKRNESLNTEDFTPEKPPKPPEVPPEVPPQDTDVVDPNAPTIAIPAPEVSANVDIGGTLKNTGSRQSRKASVGQNEIDVIVAGRSGASRDRCERLIPLEDDWFANAFTWIQREFLKHVHAGTGIEIVQGTRED